MTSLSTLIARRFIATPNVYAIQNRNGSWRPARAFNPETGKHDGPDLPFTKQIIDSHLAGEQTIGHYLVNSNNECKIFAFDIDLIKDEAPWIQYPSSKDIESLEEKFGDDMERKNAAWEHLVRLGKRTGIPREIWQDKKHPSRPYLLRQMRGMVEMLSQRISRELDIPVVSEISGLKGVHVLAMTGMIPAADARALAMSVIESFDRFVPDRGNNFFRDTLTDPEEGFPTLEVEIYPKADTINRYGNLLALPLGVNQKAPNTKKFFIDQRAAHTLITPRKDPEALLETGQPWA